MRLLLADYFPTRVGMKLALGAEYGVCAEAETADEAILAAGREQPDLCLVGLELSGGAVPAIRGIRGAAPYAAVIVLTAVYDVEDMLAVIRAGAIGYVSGALEPERLRRVVGAAAAGEAAVPRAVVLELIRELQGMRSGVEGLTTRESEVLAMLRRRQSTAAIAARLGISPVTVRRHVSALVQKTGVEDRAGLVSLDARA